MAPDVPGKAWGLPRHVMVWLAGRVWACWTAYRAHQTWAPSRWRVPQQPGLAGPTARSALASGPNWVCSPGRARPALAPVLRCPERCLSGPVLVALPRNDVVPWSFWFWRPSIRAACARRVVLRWMKPTGQIRPSRSTCREPLYFRGQALWRARKPGPLTRFSLSGSGVFSTAEPHGWIDYSWLRNHWVLISSPL